MITELTRMVQDRTDLSFEDRIALSIAVNVLRQARSPGQAHHAVLFLAVVRDPEVTAVISDLLHLIDEETLP